MSESTYFLDLKNSSMIRSISGRLANMDATLRIFPIPSDQDPYMTLRSSNITFYKDAEFNVPNGELEEGSNVTTGEGSNKFITLCGTTNWSNSSVSLQYSKYSTGKFSAQFLLNLNAKRGEVDDNGEVQHFQYKMLFPLSLIKHSIDSIATSIDGFGTDTGNVITECRIVRYNTVPHIEIATSLSSIEGDYFDVTNLKINVSGFYDMNLDNA